MSLDKLLNQLVKAKLEQLIAKYRAMLESAGSEAEKLKYSLILSMLEEYRRELEVGEE